MDTNTILNVLRDEGNRLTDTAAGLPLDAAIPTCPGWTVRDLLRHLGGVHRWAGMHVREARPDLLVVTEQVELFGAWPADDALVDWYRAEHALLVESLESAVPDLACVTFLPAPSPLHFWVRRQAHETTIHRVDVETAAGSISPIAADLAVDGIDELVVGMVPRPHARLRTTTPRTLRIMLDDSPARWLLRIGDGPVVTERDGDASEACDCTVSGIAADLYLTLWNRRGIDGLRVDGDGTMLDLFRHKITIRWS